MSHGAGEACWSSGGSMMSMIGLQGFADHGRIYRAVRRGLRLQHVNEAMDMRQRAEIPDETRPL
jgi:hypothetical protein